MLYTPSSSPLIPVFFEHFSFCSFPLSLFFFSLLRVASGETFWKGSMPFFCFSAPPHHSSSSTTDCEYGVHMVLVLLLPSPLPSLFHGKGSRVWLILNCCSSAILCPLSDLTNFAFIACFLSCTYLCMFIPIDSKLWLNIQYFDPMLWLNGRFFTNGQTQIEKAILLKEQHFVNFWKFVHCVCLPPLFYSADVVCNLFKEADWVITYA